MAGIADRPATDFGDHGVPSLHISDVLLGGRELPHVWAKMIKIPLLPEIFLCVRKSKSDALQSCPKPFRGKNLILIEFYYSQLLRGRNPRLCSLCELQLMRINPPAPLSIELSMWLPSSPILLEAASREGTACVNLSSSCC